jgi:hypothetical protein
MFSSMENVLRPFVQLAYLAELIGCQVVKRSYGDIKSRFASGQMQPLSEINS